MDSVTIKRYGNRKLYNLVTSQYVTLADVSQMVRDGKRVKVISAPTKEDITVQTLATAIYNDGLLLNLSEEELGAILRNTGKEKSITSFWE